MKPGLLYRDGGFDTAQQPPAHAEALREDLGLDALFDVMANGDPFLREVAAKVFLVGLPDADAVLYRQQVLADCLHHRQLIVDLYDLAVQAIAEEKRVWFLSIRNPDVRLHRSVQVLEIMVPLLRRLRQAADDNIAVVSAPGLRELLRSAQTELDDPYLEEVTAHLETLRFKRGMHVSARLGTGCKGDEYQVRLPAAQPGPWWKRLRLKADSLTITVDPRDDAGARAIGELRNNALNDIANAVGQSADHVVNFFRALRYELAFYLGCVNLLTRLAEKGEASCFPVPASGGRITMTARGLYDIGLALRRRDRVVGNDLNADGASVILVTGANQGGKSTFARAVALAQLMMQAGMFVAAESFTALVRPAVLTHYKREEDTTLTAGKLVEELGRMSDIVDQLTPRCLLVMNESFSSTNEGEAARIGSSLLRALAESEVTVLYVTHTFDLAQQFTEGQGPAALLLRAERLPDGRRTFRIVPEPPTATSHGEDLYQLVFGRPLTRPSKPRPGSSRRRRAGTGKTR